jgi:hypothetical protein
VCCAFLLERAKGFEPSIQPYLLLAKKISAEVEPLRQDGQPRSHPPICGPRRETKLLPLNNGERVSAIENHKNVREVVPVGILS